jgi:hypothetical protein
MEPQELFLSIGQELTDSQKGQLFGKPCFKYNGKAFICFFQNEIVFKLEGEAHGKAVRLQGAQLFDPSGKKRPMKEWVQVPFVHETEWHGFAQKAHEYAQSGK